MAAKIRKLGYCSMNVPNRAGAGARLLEALRNEDVNLLAFTGLPERGGAHQRHGARCRDRGQEALRRDSLGQAKGRGVRRGCWGRGRGELDGAKSRTGANLIFPFLGFFEASVDARFKKPETWGNSTTRLPCS